MKKATLFAGLLAVAALVCVSGLSATEHAEPAVDVKPVVEVLPGSDPPLVQMAILLDTSGSMSGLIDQARTELWSIVNEFIFARQNGRQPEVQVALYEYGKSSLSAESGYIRRIVPLTTDLDKISEELFALQTNGGDEYCGWVIREATAGLDWSESPDDLKVIFIAGNEPFTQGPVDYRQSCKAAVAKGIMVNTIHCGSHHDGVNGMWKDGAVLADGRALNIDQNRQVVHIAAPQDKAIAELGLKLNQTYVAYGYSGAVARERQVAQDKNAAQASPHAEVQRALTKASRNYRNDTWDLVDAVAGQQVDLEAVEAEQLPEAMQKMDADERKVYVAGKAKERAALQKQIRTLNDQRSRFVAEAVKKQQGGEETLGAAIKQAVREQAGKKNYTFEPAAPPSASTDNAEKK